ncbi:MAG: hypothetical protein VW339_02625, partial [Quisquiliibacterium sp.]
MENPIFGRRGRPGQRRAGNDAPERGESPGRESASPDALRAQREQARRTAEKIDRIESEMMSA